MENKVIAYKDIMKLELCDHSVPEIGDDEVLVHIRATALCTQEQRWYKGIKKVFNYPAVAGHESAGDVVAVGKKVTAVKVGDRVALGGGLTLANGLRPRRFPGEQAPEADSDGFYEILQGSLAKYVKRSQHDVIKVSDKMDYKYLSLTEPLADVVSSVNKANPQFADLCVVIGAGIMGLLHTQLLKMRGAIVVVSEIDPARKAKAKEMGADYVVDPREVDLVEYVKGLSEFGGARCVFNTTAIHENWEVALKLMAPEGCIICYSSQHPDTPVGISMGWVHNTKVRIIGTVGCTSHEMWQSAQLIANGLVKLDEVIDSEYKFEDFQAAFDKSIIPGTYRVIITD